MSVDFLSVDAAAGPGGNVPVARSPMERSARAAGARFAVRDGWNVAINYGNSSAESEAEGRAARAACGWADVSHLGKLELQGSAEALSELVRTAGEGAELRLGTATRAAEAWWCPLTPMRTLVIAEPAVLAALRARLAESAGDVSIVDVTTTWAALTLIGPLAREVFARFSAIDLRPRITPVTALRPGSIARQPGILICEARDRYLLLFGWATGEYVWSVVADAGHHLGGRAVGLEMLAELTAEDPLDGSGRSTEAANA